MSKNIEVVVDESIDWGLLYVDGKLHEKGAIAEVSSTALALLGVEVGLYERLNPDIADAKIATLDGFHRSLGRNYG